MISKTGDQSYRQTGKQHQVSNTSTGARRPITIKRRSAVSLLSKQRKNTKFDAVAAIRNVRNDKIVYSGSRGETPKAQCLEALVLLHQVVVLGEKLWVLFLAMGIGRFSIRSTT